MLEAHREKAKREDARLLGLYQAERTAILQVEAALDPEKIALAETVIQVHGLFEKAGEDRESARTAAVHWIATGEGGYRGLKSEFFGTKDYDRWHGQRSDHEYGYGPKHGSVIFCIGLVTEARKRDLTEPEKEAAIYYLLNLTAIQKAQQEAKAAA
jgi:hypothetical protein